jgi:hypothetical protein
MTMPTKKRRVLDPNVESSDDEGWVTPSAKHPSSPVEGPNAVVVELMKLFATWQKEDEDATQNLVKFPQPPAKKPRKNPRTALDVLTQHFECTEVKLAKILEDPLKVAEAMPLLFCKHFFPMFGGKSLFPVIPCGLDRKPRPFQTYDLMFDFLKHPYLPHVLVLPAYGFTFQSYSCPLELLYLPF